MARKRSFLLVTGLTFSELKVFLGGWRRHRSAAPRVLLSSNQNDTNNAPHSRTAACLRACANAPANVCPRRKCCRTQKVREHDRDLAAFGIVPRRWLGRSRSSDSARCQRAGTLVYCCLPCAPPLFGRIDVKSEFDSKESWVDSSFGVFSLSGHCPCDANAGGGCTRSGRGCDSGRRHRGHHWRGIRRRPWSGHWCDHRWCHWCRYRCRRGAAAGWLPLLPGCLLSRAARRSVARCFA